MSVPEPAPKNEGVAVTPIVIERLETFSTKSMIKLIRDRDAFGFAKYGQHLMTGDGRDSIEDAKQELGDLMQYMTKAQLNNENMEELYELIDEFIGYVDMLKTYTHY